MAPLTQILARVDNTTSVGWSKIGSYETSSAVGPLLREISLISHHLQVHSSTFYIASDNSNTANSASQIMHITDTMFLQQFRSTFLQPTPLHLLPLPSNCK